MSKSLDSTTAVAIKDVTPLAKRQEDGRPWLVVRVDDQQFALDIAQVQGVQKQWQCTEIPLSPSEVVGSMNLRGRIITMIDVGCALQMRSVVDQTLWKAGVVVEQGQFLYCLMVDEVGDVLTLSDAGIKPSPANLSPSLKPHSRGVFQQKDNLLIMLDMSSFLHYEEATF